MLRKFFIFILVLALTACAKVSNDLIRQAKLMPRDIAIQTVDKYTPMGFSTHPALPRYNSHVVVCTDKTPKPVRFEDMLLLAGFNKVSVFVIYGGDVLCGRSLSTEFKVSNQNERDELFDALIALGAKPAMAED